MPFTKIQPSFAKGEVSPALYGRVDTTAYQVALRKARNAVIHSFGGVSNRPGTTFIGPSKDHSNAGRLIPFKFSATDTYILEFGNLYMRVIRNDAHVLETAVNISGATQANPVVVTATSHGYSNGDEVFITGVVGMTELNGNRYVIANVTANTFELTDQVTGANIDGTGFTAYSSAGTVARVFTLTTSYAVADLPELKYVQSADVMTLVHPTYSPRELTRTDHDAWTLTEIAFNPAQDHPTGEAVVPAGAPGAVTVHYQVTAISANEEESLPGLDATNMTITAATQADPVVVTSTAHGLTDGDEIEINGVVGMTELNARRFRINNGTANTFELQNTNGVDIDGTGFTAYSSGGTANRTFTFLTTAAGTPNNDVSWTAVAGADRYAIYKRENGIYGLVGEAQTLTFRDSNVDADTTISPPRYVEVFDEAGDFPGAVGYFEQRRVFGGSDNQPDTVRYSVTGDTANFTRSVPSQADDAITATLNANEVNQIRHFVTVNDFIVFTSGSEWRINAGDDAGFAADTMRQKPQSNWGSSQRRPIPVGTSVLYVQQNDAVVRSIGYSLQQDGYTGNNIGLLAEHLLRNNTITDWAFSRFPDPIVFMTRDDGQVLTLTFDQEQEVVAWTTWDTDGDFEAVAAVRPSTDISEEPAYFIVKRTINGNTVRYIERTHTRNFTDIRDAFFVDSGLSLDSPVTISGVTLADPAVVTATAHGFSNGDEIDIFDITWVADTDSVFNETQPAQLNTKRFQVADQATNTFSLVAKNAGVDITGATQANPCVITATAHGFSDGDVIGIFDVNGMTELNGLTYTVANSTTDTFELSGIDSTAFTAYTSAGKAYHALDSSAFNAYVEGGTARLAVTNISGLDHLEGEAVKVLADGNVVSSLTVSSGAITLPEKASRVHVGLGFTSDIQTLDLEDTRAGSLMGKKKKIAKVTLRFRDSRGLLVGHDFEPDLMELVKWREDELMGDPTAIFTGDKELPLPPDWNEHGRLAFRQQDPLPLTILAVAPELEIGD